MRPERESLILGHDALATRAAAAAINAAFRKALRYIEIIVAQSAYVAGPPDSRSARNRNADYSSSHGGICHARDGDCGIRGRRSRITPLRAAECRSNSN